MFYGERCEFKNADLVIKENVSRSFSVLAIFTIIMTYAFFISLDAMRFVFKIEPEGLSDERQQIRRKKLIKKIMDDLRDKKKRKRYRKLIKTGYKYQDPFIYNLERTFHISYDLDLRYIDEDSVIDLNAVGGSINGHHLGPPTSIGLLRPPYSHSRASQRRKSPKRVIEHHHQV